VLVEVVARAPLAIMAAKLEYDAGAEDESGGDCDADERPTAAAAAV